MKGHTETVDVTMSGAYAAVSRSGSESKLSHGGRSTHRRYEQDVSTYQERSGNLDGPVIEEITEDDISYDADIEIVRPDFYEDAADSGPDESDRPKSGSLKDGEQWQNEIVDSMRTLACNSDAEDSQDSGAQAQSKKRRSHDSGTSVRYRSASYQSAALGTVEIAHDDEGRSSPKRPRMRSRRSRHRDSLARRLLPMSVSGYEVVDSASARPASFEHTRTHDGHLRGADDGMDLD